MSDRRLTVQFLAHEHEDMPWTTIEVDFSGHATGMASSATAAERLQRAASERLSRLRP